MLALKAGREGEALRSAGSEFQTVAAMKPKERSLKDFKFVLGISEQSFCRRTKGARWSICGEKRRQVWRKSAVEVTESEHGDLVVNAVFICDPMDFFSKAVLNMFWEHSLYSTNIASDWLREELSCG